MNRKTFSQIIFLILVIGIAADHISTACCLTFFPDQIYEANPRVRWMMDQNVWIVFDVMSAILMYGGLLWIYDTIPQDDPRVHIMEVLSVFPAIIYGGLRFFIGLYNIGLILSIL